MKILIADDDRTIRIALQGLLNKWGYDVLPAEDGDKAWEILQQPGAPRIAILDWMMPGMEGPSLCRRIRDSRLGSYVYVILLTAKSEKTDLLEGLESGADDFVSKPFNAGELKARIKAAERILSLERELKIRNEELDQSNKRLIRSNEIITKDLQVAATVQQSLLPSRSQCLNGFCFDSLFMPCTIVGGDMFNCFQLGSRHLAFYILDISGHGVPAAMLSVTVSKTLTALLWEQAMEHGILRQEAIHPISPRDMVDRLNRLFQTSDSLPVYFTMILGVADTQTGRTVLTQAGHPHPIHLPRNGPARALGNGGFPVGLLEEATYSQKEVVLEPGDRLILYTDGVTECQDCHEQEFSADRFSRLLEENRSLDLQGIIRKTGEELYRHRGGDLFSDDISLMVLERKRA